MLAQSYFQLDNFDDALAFYKAAQIKLKATPSSNQPQKRLIMLHGAQSANQVGEFKTAIDMATPLTLLQTEGADAAESALVHSAWLEIAKARLAVGEIDGAMDGLDPPQRTLEKQEPRRELSKATSYSNRKNTKTRSTSINWSSTGTVALSRPMKSAPSKPTRFTKRREPVTVESRTRHQD